ncbi:hypothetical protein HDU82_008539 [Entophlyctis luteolus]|nr:hypothetical protein HDU82_008539 [Entophlyctis luteolus]
MVAAAIVSLADLHSGLDDRVSNAIEDAFGKPQSLGIILVQLPSQHPYHSLRRNLLSLAPTLAHLRTDLLLSLEHPESNYSFGWSCGRELMNGVPDRAKGSYYAQISDRIRPAVADGMARDDDELEIFDSHFAALFPSYAFPNIWPDAEVLPLKTPFLNLGRCFVEVGVLLAAAMDRFLAGKAGPGTRFSSLKDALSSPRNCHKGRLLYYFPYDEVSKPQNGSWCGTHLDHSVLTGLTCPITNQTAPLLDNSGLFIQPADSAEFVRVEIPPDCMAFQVSSELAR